MPHEFFKAEFSVDDQNKRDMFRLFVPVVSVRVGKELDRTELLALGYLVDRLIPRGVSLSAEIFLSQMFGVSGEDDARAVAKKISGKLLMLKMQELGDVASQTDPQQIKWRTAVRAFVESGAAMVERSQKSAMAPIYLGGVPDFLLPDWVKIIV